MGQSVGEEEAGVASDTPARRQLHTDAFSLIVLFHMVVVFFSAPFGESGIFFVINVLAAKAGEMKHLKDVLVGNDPIYIHWMSQVENLLYVFVGDRLLFEIGNNNRDSAPRRGDVPSGLFLGRRKRQQITRLVVIHMDLIRDFQTWSLPTIPFLNPKYQLLTHHREFSQAYFSYPYPSALIQAISFNGRIQCHLSGISILLCGKSADPRSDQSENSYKKGWDYQSIFPVLTGISCFLTAIVIAEMGVRSLRLSPYPWYGFALLLFAGVLIVYGALALFHWFLSPLPSLKGIT